MPWSAPVAKFGRRGWSLTINTHMGLLTARAHLPAGVLVLESSGLGLRSSPCFLRADAPLLLSLRPPPACALMAHGAACFASECGGLTACHTRSRACMIVGGGHTGG